MAEKILIVDDDADTVKYLGLFIARLGYEPLQAMDGMQALKLAYEQRPDLIILDVMMPELDGYEVARHLRRRPETALIPILMFTARSQPQDRSTGYEVGVDLFLTKPVHPIEMQANIKKLLAQHKTRANARENKGYVVGVLAARGGLGVSSLVLNLAVAYKYNHNARVIAAEMRPGQGCWADELGFSATGGLVDLLHASRPEITRAAVEKQLLSNTFGVPLLLSSEVCSADCVGALAQFEAVVEELSRLADLVVLDIGTNFHPAYEVLSSACEEMILVAEHQPVTIKRTLRLLSDLKNRGFSSLRELTLVTIDKAQTETGLTDKQVEDALGYAITRSFPPAPELAHLAASRAMPLYLAQPDSPISEQFNALADHIAKHMGTRAAH